MATTSAGNTRRISLGGSDRRRRRVHPARKRLAIATALVILGSFLPWLYVGGIPLSGARGAGLWTFYVSMLGLAGALLPYHRIGGWHAAIMAVVAVVLPMWQLVHTVDEVGFSGWLPGPGLVMVLFGGILAAGSALQLLREPAPA